MDSAGIKYEYEKEAYNLDGLCYLPDFYLPQLNKWLEIKGAEITEEELEKAKRLNRATSETVLIYVGSPEAPFSSEHCKGAVEIFTYMNLDGALEFYCEGWAYWCECPTCGECDLHYEGVVHQMHCKCRSKSRRQFENHASPKLLRAYAAARGYRFEPNAKNYG